MKKKITRSEKISLLKEEYLLLQKSYEDFDKRLIGIKGWSLTISTAAIGVGLYKPHWLWLFAGLSSLVFWVLEAMWKSFQYNYLPRIQEIEEAFLTGDFADIAPFQVMASWSQMFVRHDYRLLSTMRGRAVMFPHILTFLVAMVLFALESFGFISMSR